MSSYQDRVQAEAAAKVVEFEGQVRQETALLTDLYQKRDGMGLEAAQDLARDTVARLHRGYANAERVGADARVAKRAGDFDESFMEAASVAAERDGVPVATAIVELLKASRALDLARLAAARGARIPAACACLAKAWRAAAAAPRGEAVKAAAAVVARLH